MIICYAPPTTPSTKSIFKLQSDYVVLHHLLERSLIPRPRDLGTRLEYINWERQFVISISATFPNLAVASSLIPRSLTSPVFDHLGKAWEILPILVTSGRQRVHTWGLVPNRYSSHFTSTCPRRREQWMVYWYCLANAPLRQTLTGKSSKASDPSVSTWHHHTWPYPSIFGNDQIKTEGGEGLGIRLCSSASVVKEGNLRLVLCIALSVLPLFLFHADVLSSM